MASFAYVLHLEFPEPGMYGFERILDGPMHTWLLWDRSYMKLSGHEINSQLRRMMLEEIDPVTDTVRIFHLCGRCIPATEVIETGTFLDADEADEVI